jgi:hypothetical protein
MAAETPVTLLPRTSSGILRQYKSGDIILVRLTSGEVAIAVYHGDDGTIAQLWAPRILKLEKMHLVFTDFMMASNAKTLCDVVIAHIIAVGKPTSEAEAGYRSLSARL